MFVQFCSLLNELMQIRLLGYWESNTLLTGCSDVITTTLHLSGCRAYTWNKGKNGNCYLKSKPNQPRPDHGSYSAIMGPAVCPAGEKCVLYNDGSSLGERGSTVASDAARADVAVVFVATSSGEGRDRNR